jgi:ATP-dependent Clp protease ATP-binding subunit ClpA
MGARPLKRLINETIKQLLADHILASENDHGTNIAIDIHQDKPVLRVFETN